MEIHIVADADAGAKVVADLFERTVRDAGDSGAVLGLATGSSPVPTYTELIRRHREEGLSFAACRAFLLDEYVGLPTGHEQSYHAFIRENFVSKVDIEDASVISPNGAATDPAAEAAEYDRRMEQGNLTVIVNIPEDAPRAMADGRLLWRVLDNLFNNVCKYALAGTRVYIDAGIEGNEAVISVKNISRDPLNVSADELMERFVRGDSSRHTEGSGLGLNIAQSLVNLMHGKFSLSVDGDLFKAEIRLPLN